VHQIDNCHSGGSVCEIKFSKNAVPPAVVSEVKEKIARISLPRHMSYQPVLIHTGAIADRIAEEGYFASMIDFRDLMVPAETPWLYGRAGQSNKTAVYSCFPRSRSIAR
jgi:hypothetical protein